MIPDNAEFYKTLYRRFKKYAPITLFGLACFFSVFPIIFHIINKESFYLQEDAFSFAVSYGTYKAFVMNIALSSFFTNKKWYTRLISFILWGVQTTQGVYTIWLVLALFTHDAHQ